MKPKPENPDAGGSVWALLKGGMLDPATYEKFHDLVCVRHKTIEISILSDPDFEIYDAFLDVLLCACPGASVTRVRLTGPTPEGAVGVVITLSPIPAFNWRN
jgi:hypothetical protein